MPVSTAQVQVCPGNESRPASSLPNRCCTASPRFVQSWVELGIRCRRHSTCSRAICSESRLSSAMATYFQRCAITAPWAPIAAFRTRCDLREACIGPPPHVRSVYGSCSQQIGPRPVSPVNHQLSVPSSSASHVNDTNAFNNTCSS
jgi:hypothetical protein